MWCVLADVAYGVRASARRHRGEVAAWRYGLTLLRRRRRAVVPALGVTVAALGGNSLLAAGMIGTGATMAGVLGGFAVLAASMRRTWNPMVRLADGSARRLRSRESESVRLEPDGDGWALRWDAAGARTSSTAPMPHAHSAPFSPARTSAVDRPRRQPRRSRCSTRRAAPSALSHVSLRHPDDTTLAASSCSRQTCDWLWKWRCTRRARGGRWRERWPRWCMSGERRRR